MFEVKYAVARMVPVDPEFLEADGSGLFALSPEIDLSECREPFRKIRQQFRSDLALIPARAKDSGDLDPARFLSQGVIQSSRISSVNRL